MNKKKESASTEIRPYTWSSFGLLDEMGRLFDDLRFGLGGPWLTPFVSMRTRVPAVDIKDVGTGYFVEAEIPGVAKEDVEIEIGEDAIEISAKREEEKEEKGEGYIRKERGSLRFYRRLPLPDDVDREKVEAKMENGVLRISLPKAERLEEAKKKVEIK